MHTQLGDRDGIAANWSLALIDLRRENYKTAIPRVIESFQILRHLQRADGLAIVGETLATLLIAAGITNQARHVLRDGIQAAIKIGNADLIQRYQRMLDQIGDEGGQQ
ncbi:hypothetical protein [Actinocrispum wychmicini]|uniref:MalT-like TPR region domain-containing protein n=1 Tax=Actinocrispum wychmicini TaxID=1213861 RepID=A0A4R2JUX8_9PSEU|nr:hypothetical protein [Actinocrispum wychmicini]TCO64241.1 hypothetical protein EV192_1015 [Actinocrispum wychmicini]